MSQYTNLNIPMYEFGVKRDTVVNQHNYPMTPSPITTIAKYHKFNSDMIQFIEFCVKSEISGAQPIGQLLKSKFLEI
ncbi:860_t:CDS:1, partial [Dentiscutata erythropus]